MSAHRATTWEISESEDESGTECKPDFRYESFTNIESYDSQRKEDNLNTLSIPTTTCKQTLSPTRLPKSPNRKRRSKPKEQMEAGQLEAKRIREERENQRRIIKEERRRQQQERKELAEHMRSLRPDNCLKCLTICVDPAVLQQDGSDMLVETLSASGLRFVFESQQLPGSISWTRDLVPQPVADGPVSVEEEQVFWILDLADFIDLVICVKQRDGGHSRKSLFSVLLEFLNHNAEKVVTALVIGSQVNSSTAWDERSLQAQIGMDDLDFEEVMVYLQVYRNISFSFLCDWQEVSERLGAVTKALSKRPFKLLTESAELPFCVDGSWAAGARVEKDGCGLGQVWNRQVQQLNRVSSAVATAITDAYPSPQLLLQAYRSVDSEEERRKLLAHLTVTVEGKERRVGPDISGRMYRCLSLQNPQLVLD